MIRLRPRRRTIGPSAGRAPPWSRGHRRSRRRAWTRRPRPLPVRSGEGGLRAHRGTEPRQGSGSEQPSTFPSALPAQGAEVARRAGRGAHRGTEIEHGLVELPRPSGRQQAVGHRLGLAHRQPRPGHAAGQYPQHVGVDRRHVGPEGERPHRPGGVRPDAGQRAQGPLVGGDGTSVLVLDRHGRPVQIERPAVVAQTRPEPHHVARPGPGTVRRRWGRRRRNAR